MRWRSFALGFVMIVGIVAVSGLRAEAAGLGCPQLCLTGGGLLGGGSTSASVSGVEPLDGVSSASNGIQTRTENFTWLAGGNAEDSPVGAKAYQVNVTSAGHERDGVYDGRGQACISNGEKTVCLDVDVSDDGLLYTASGSGFSAAAVAGALGEATWTTSSPPWEGAPDEDCDGHENDSGIGHIISGGQGHDCDGN